MKHNARSKKKTRKLTTLDTDIIINQSDTHGKFGSTVLPAAVSIKGKAGKKTQKTNIKKIKNKKIKKVSVCVGVGKQTTAGEETDDGR